MSKGIAIQTILMLLVGILVVGIIVYMVYRYMLSPGLSEQECRTRAISWCTTCKNANWTASISAPGDLASCAPNYFASGWAGRCDGVGPSPGSNWCRNFGVT